MYQKQYKVKTLDTGEKAYVVTGYSFGIVAFEAEHEGSKYEFVWRRTRASKQSLRNVWLINDTGKPVGILSYRLLLEKSLDDPFRFVLESIEIREEHRGNGLAGFLIREVEKWVGETMHCTGHYTTLGYQSLDGFLPVADTSEYNNFGKGTVEFEDMSFVKDWDRMIPLK